MRLIRFQLGLTKNPRVVLTVDNGKLWTFMDYLLLPLIYDLQGGNLIKTCLFCLVRKLEMIVPILGRMRLLRKDMR